MDANLFGEDGIENATERRENAPLARIDVAILSCLNLAELVAIWAHFRLPSFPLATDGREHTYRSRPHTQETTP
jgi:hypothetical protein